MSTQAGVQNPFLQWDNSYSVNIELIDYQHKKLFKDINQLLQLLDKKIDVLDVEAIIDNMIDYIAFHFTTEEKLLVQHPEFISHKAEHQLFIEKTNQFDRELFATKPKETAFELYVFLGGWLQQHIQKVDRLHFAYLQSNNLLPPLG